MKPNELRVSNLVADRGGKILSIDWFDRYKVCQQMIIEGMEVHPITEEFEYLQPIPLTPEWLERFGFVADHENQTLGTYYDHGDYGVYMMGNEICDYFYTDTRLKYLHQLQNLYHALTGTELTLTEKPTE